ncbi:MAG: MBL fold metallo-hydrolase [Acidimicrobiales bacterium]
MARIDHVTTSGVFTLDGENFGVENNVWIVGDDDEAIVIDAALADETGAPILLHPDDSMLWEVVYPDRRVDDTLADPKRIEVGGAELTVIHTPGHSPGGCCLHLPTERTLFSGDTLFNGGPGATGRSFSSYDIILDSIEHRLLTLPDATTVHTGHGDSTTIGSEAEHLDEWKARRDG